MNCPVFALPTARPIYWLQANHAGDELLPAPGAYYKLACSTAVFERAEILTRWPERQHVFVVVRFSSAHIHHLREVA
jgi:hypothetical protein